MTKTTRTKEHDEVVSDEERINVANIFREALEDTKTGGNLERAKVTAILALALIIETVGVKLDNRLEEMNSKGGANNGAV